MSLRPSDIGISLIAGSALFAVAVVTILEKSLLFLLGGAIMVLVLVRALVRN
jgi:hypothetical protein